MGSQPESAISYSRHDNNRAFGRNFRNFNKEIEAAHAAWHFDVRQNATNITPKVGL